MENRVGQRQGFGITTGIGYQWIIGRRMAVNISTSYGASILMANKIIEEDGSTTGWQKTSRRLTHPLVSLGFTF